MSDRKVVEDVLSTDELRNVVVNPIGVFSGTLDEVKANVEDLFDHLKLDIQDRYELVGDISFDLVEHYDGCDIQVSFKRLETAPEYNTRIKKELKKAKAAEKRRKANLEKLLKNDDETWELYQELKKKYES